MQAGDIRQGGYGDARHSCTYQTGPLTRNGSRPDTAVRRTCRSPSVQSCLSRGRQGVRLGVWDEIRGTPVRRGASFYPAPTNNV